MRVWADALIARHLDPSWSFGFDNAKRRAGLCDYTRKRISVSRYLAARHDDDANHQTLLHEVAHAIDEKDDAELVGELGDLLLQVVFHSTIAEERGAFQLR